MNKAILCLLIAATTCAYAQQNSAAQEQKARQIMENVRKVALHGPTQIKIFDQATLDIPEDYVFIPAKEACQVMSLMGNDESDHADSVVGMVVTQQRSWDAFVFVTYQKSGHVMDDDAKSWDAGKLLAEIKENTEAANKERAKSGVSEMEVVGWVEKPFYDAATHHLVWSVEGKVKGSKEQIQTINYNTYSLNREGMLQMLLVTTSDVVSQDKQIALTLLKNLKFNSGKRYEDFNKGTDQVAAYGLAALIAGVAAKKLGLLAIIGVFLLKIWKLSFLAIVIFWKRLKNFFTGKGWTADPEPQKPAAAADSSAGSPKEPPANPALPTPPPSEPDSTDKK